MGRRGRGKAGTHSSSPVPFAHRAVYFHFGLDTPDPQKSPKSLAFPGSLPPKGPTTSLPPSGSTVPPIPRLTRPSTPERADNQSTPARADSPPNPSPYPAVSPRKGRQPVSPRKGRQSLPERADKLTSTYPLHLGFLSPTSPKTSTTFDA